MPCEASVVTPCAVAVTVIEVCAAGHFQLQTQRLAVSNRDDEPLNARLLKAGLHHLQ